MDTTELRQCIRDILASPTGTSNHTKQRRVRWTLAAVAAVEAGPGDIVEIGALKGESTVPFCRIAERYERRVLVVDPWEPGTQNCRGPEYGTFMKQTEVWQTAGVLEVLRLPSQDAEAIAVLQARAWAFALVDGLHDETACLSDIRAVQRARVICVDDLNMKPVRKACARAAAEMPEREPIQDATLARKWEGYLV